MDEKFTREKKSSRRRVEPEAQTKEKTYGSKLKNDLSRNEAMRKKLRTGKADFTETLQEKKKKAQLRKQGRSKSYAEAAALAKARHQMANYNEDENAGVEAVDMELGLAEGAVYSRKAQPKSKKSNGYGKKLYQKSPFEEVNGAKGTGAAITKEGTNQVQKNLMKKEIQRQAYNAGAKEAAHGFGSFTAKFVDKAEDLAGKLAEGVIETVKSHPLLCLLAVGILLLIVSLSGCTSTIGLMGGGISGTTLTTTFTAQDDDILAVDEAYTDLEAEIRQVINNIETDYPGYDEYNYSLNEISHNPFELAALLTVLYEDYTPGEVASMLQTIKSFQYELTTEEVVETRTRTVTKWHWVTRYRTEIVNGVEVQVPYQSYESYQVEEEYEYYILNVTLVSHVGIYVGDGMMLHCGNPIQYASINSSYWQSHFYTFGRLNH